MIAISIIISLVIITTVTLTSVRRAQQRRPATTDDSSKTSPDTDSAKSAPAPATTKLTVRSLWIRRLIWIPISVLLVTPWIASWRTAPPPAQVVAPAPKWKLQPNIERRGLDLIGGDGIFNDEGFIGVQREGRAFFKTHDMPWRNDAVFHVVAKIRQEKTATILIKINGQWTKSLVHPGSPIPTNIVLFEAGEVGSPDYFNPSGINNIEVSSLGGDNMTIHCVSIEMIYRK